MSERLADELAALFALVARAAADPEGDLALTATQRLALTEIALAGPLRLRELACRIRSLDPTASRAVDGLVAAGLVERIADPTDRRAIRIAATELGAGYVRERRGRAQALLVRACADLPPEERERLVEAVSTLRRDVERLAADPQAGRGLLFAGR